MQINRILFIAVLMLGTSSGAWAQWGSMKLIAPNVGWAEPQRFGISLFWTTDGGVHWKNISPDRFSNSETLKLDRFETGSGDERESISDVFFLDTHKGWVLFCCNYPDTAKHPDEKSPEYNLAMTTDTGASWSMAHVAIPDDVHVEAVDNNGGEIAFANSLYGWMHLYSCETHSCGGPLLINSDGGRTWRAAPHDLPDGEASFSLVTPTLGWSVTIPNQWEGTDKAELYVTRDGARSWQQVSVPFPKQILSAADVSQSPPTAFYNDLPTFEDSKHGLLPVTYMAENADSSSMAENADSESAIVLFETLDGGRSWKPVRALTNLSTPRMPQSYSVAVTDSTLIAVTASSDQNHTMLSKDGPNGRTDIDISTYTRPKNLVRRHQDYPANTNLPLSFATPKQGWMQIPYGLSSTTDGGATWTTHTFMPESEVPNSAAFKRVRSRVDVDSMQLLSSDIGWTLVYGKLYWTESGGTDWKDISPPGPNRNGAGISSAFFLDTERGWALSRDGNRLLVFSTTNAGGDWSTTWVNIPGLQLQPYVVLLNGKIYFADSLHGWISVAAENKAKDSEPGLLVTSDGGRTWDRAPSDVGSAGYIRFLTLTEGWKLVPPSDELYVTRDGAKSWQKVSLPPPKEVYPATEPTYDLPTFQDSKHGFIPVTYSGGLGVKAAAVLFATEDGGQTWKPNRILANLNGMPVGNRVASAVVGPAWLTATLVEPVWITQNQSDDSRPTVTTITSGATVNAGSDASPGYYGAVQLSFVTPTRGWVSLNHGRALSTTDGGATWADLMVAQNWRVIARQPAPRLWSVVSMQLLGPEVGVATLGNSTVGEPTALHLFRTETGGAQWKEISPRLTYSDKIVSNFFFLDATHGWIVLWHWGPVAPSSWFRRWWRAGRPAKPELEPTFELVSTTDAGATWSRTRIDNPELASLRDTILPKAQVSFADSLHGWVDLTVSVASNPNSHWEKGLITADGGKTWNQAPSTPIKPTAVRFLTPLEGWMLGDPSKPAAAVSPSPSGHAELPPSARGLGGPLVTNPILARRMMRMRRTLPGMFGWSMGGRLPMAPDQLLRDEAGKELYVTRDGAKSWQKVSLAPPEEVYSEDLARHPPPISNCGKVTGYTMTDVTYHPPTAIYDLPTFTDSEHGFLPVTYLATSDTKWVGTNLAVWMQRNGVACSEQHYHAVLFATADSGRTWKPDRILVRNPVPFVLGCNPCTVVSAVAGSAWIVANHSEAIPPSFTTLDTGTGGDTSGDGDRVFWPLMDRGLLRLDFATSAIGWIIWRGELLSTTNGGATWTPITPKLNQPVARP